MSGLMGVGRGWWVEGSGEIGVGRRERGEGSGDKRVGRLGGDGSA